MKQAIQTTTKDVIASIDAYLLEINKTSEQENLAEQMYYVFNTLDFDSALQGAAIIFTDVLRALANPEVSTIMKRSIADYDGLCDLLVDFTRIFNYMRDSKGCMAAMERAFWD